MYGPYDHSWMFGGGMLLGGLWVLLLWIIPLLVILALLKYLFAKHGKQSEPESKQAPPSALELLKQSYARGEISREEYLQKRDDLLEK